VTQAEARAALAAFDGLGGLERWIAAQRPWEATPAGWTVPEPFQTSHWFRTATHCGSGRVACDNGFVTEGCMPCWGMLLRMAGALALIALSACVSVGLAVAFVLA
jgi:hypothetical protein